jgi:vacuolar-type H+-ATPase subunit I/STV1
MAIRIWSVFMGGIIGTAVGLHVFAGVKTISGFEGAALNLALAAGIFTLFVGALLVYLVYLVKAIKSKEE